MRYSKFAAALALLALRCLGQEWHGVHVPFTAKMFAEGNGQVIALDGGYTALGRIYLSEDLTNWTQHSTDFPVEIYDLKFGNGVFVGIGFQTSYVSSDGLNWSAHRLKESGYQLAIGNEKFLTAGSGGWIMTSQDAQTWRSVQMTNGYPFFTATTFGNGRFLITGSGTAFVSETGEVWEGKRLPTNIVEVTQLAFGRGMFVALARAVGGYLAEGTGASLRALQTDGEDKWWANNLIVASTNGLDWQTVHTTTNGILKGVVYGNGLFVGYGTRGTVLASTDGMNWKEQQLPNRQFGVGFVKDRFIRSGLGFFAIDVGFLAVSDPIITLRPISGHKVGVYAPAREVQWQMGSSVNGPWTTFTTISPPFSAAGNEVDLPQPFDPALFIRALLSSE